MNTRSTLQLDDAELAFLKKYCPADDMVTTPAEIGEVILQLSLTSRQDRQELQSLRNAVVSLYDDGGMCLEGMQSVTAVIDHRMLMLEQANK